MRALERVSWLLKLLQVFRVENDLDHETARRTDGHFLSVPEIVQRDLKLVTTGTRIGQNAHIRVVEHVFDFDFVVERHLVQVLDATGVAEDMPLKISNYCMSAVRLHVT